MKTLNFCTLFNTAYMSRGLALQESLLKNCNDFSLYIFAFDDICFQTLNELNLKNTIVISLKEFEDNELLRVKPTRTSTEYCWTCTSSTILYVIENFKVDHCTYIDADIYFYSNPKVLIEEMGSKSILLTLHRYSDEYAYYSKDAGKYCVQFITFKNDKPGLKALRWWREACIDWCYAKPEDGKFGDQKYLEDWCERFEGVHVLEHLGGGVAPWNATQYTFFDTSGKKFGIELTTNTQFEVIFFHFHNLRFINNRWIQYGAYDFSKDLKTIIYNVYVVAIRKIREKLQKNHPQLVNKDRIFSPEWKVILKYIRQIFNKKFKKLYHNLSYFK